MSRFLGTRASKLLGNFARIYATKSPGDTVRVDRRRLNSRAFLGLLAGGVATCAGVIYALDKSVVEAAELVAHPPSYPWGFKRIFASLDHAAVRRGWQVYKTICSQCHGIQWVAFRDFVDVFMSEEEARAVAAEYTVRDGPDDKGQYYDRPCKLTDRVPSPFPNEEAARAANDGSYPPDLSYIVLGRHNGYNYVFSLLTGYPEEPPVGLEMAEGRSYNAYFEGGAINMAQALFNDAVQYDDGTPAYLSQMAKDVVEFLAWTSGQEWDSRIIVCAKYIILLALAMAFVFPVYRKKMNHHRRAVIAYIPKRKSN